MEEPQEKPKQRIAEERAVIAIQAGAVTIDAEGRLWRIWRYRHKKIEVLKEPRQIGSPGKDGYWRVSICGGCPVYIHRVVFLVRVGPIPEDREVNHKDGDKGNCRPENLELKTHQGNQQHASEVLGRWKGNTLRRDYLSKKNP